MVERGTNGAPGKLLGILTNRDVRFATDPRQKISELINEGRTYDRARGGRAR